MKRDDVFPSKYLKVADLAGKPVVVTIERAVLETLKSTEGKEQDKIVLYLKGTKKSFPLNLTNWDAVADIAGDDTDDWPGHRIELYPTTTQMGGKTVDCIRVQPPSQRPLPMKQPKKQPKEQPEAPPADEFGDEIPF